MILKGVRDYLFKKAPIKQLAEDNLENTMQIEELEKLIEKFNNNGKKKCLGNCIKEC